MTILTVLLCDLSKNTDEFLERVQVNPALDRIESSLDLYVELPLMKPLVGPLVKMKRVLLLRRERRTRVSSKRGGEGYNRPREVLMDVGLWHPMCQQGFLFPRLCPVPSVSEG